MSFFLFLTLIIIFIEVATLAWRGRKFYVWSRQVLAPAITDLYGTPPRDHVDESLMSFQEVRSISLGTCRRDAGHSGLMNRLLLWIFELPVVVTLSFAFACVIAFCTITNGEWGGIAAAIISGVIMVVTWLMERIVGRRERDELTRRNKERADEDEDDDLSK